jgi:hypothetical protein
MTRRRWSHYSPVDDACSGYLASGDHLLDSRENADGRREAELTSHSDLYSATEKLLPPSPETPAHEGVNISPVINVDDTPELGDEVTQVRVKTVMDSWQAGQGLIAIAGQMFEKLHRNQRTGDTHLPQD